MELVKKILRGMLIGVANVIPGVSGGTMMVSMGIYDTIILCITHLFSQFKKSVKTLLPYLLGMLLGIFALASLLGFLFDHYPLPTNTAFIGLILGGLSPLIRKIERRKINFGCVVAFAAFFGLIIWMACMGPVQNAESVTMSAGQMLILLVMGAIASATMIIPGVSGSMVLMLLGYYTPVINALNSFKTAVFSADFAAMVQPLLVLLPFGIGVVAGIFGVAKAIEWLIQRFPTLTYCGVLGLVLASPVAILIRADLAGTTIGMAIISAITFAVGFVGAWLLDKGSKSV